jgi:hypothetical protein
MAVGRPGFLGHHLEAKPGHLVERFFLAPMALKDIVAQIDAEITRLQQARSLLTTSGIPVVLPVGRRGRPKENVETPGLSKPAKKKRNLSPEDRTRIAEAAKRRSVAQKANKKAKA